MKIEILEAAQRDLLSGYAFYERQSPGLGSYYLDSVFADIDSLRLYAGVHEVHFGRFHRMLTKRFPFAIYYRIDAEVARVYAILDSRRDPGSLADRMTTQQ